MPEVYVMHRHKTETEHSRPFQTYSSKASSLLWALLHLNVALLISWSLRILHDKQGPGEAVCSADQP